MQNWIYKQGELSGELRGELKNMGRTLRSLFVRRTGRQPTAEEELAITRRARDLGPDQLIDVADLPGDALVLWLSG